MPVIEKIQCAMKGIYVPLKLSPVVGDSVATVENVCMQCALIRN